MKNTDKQDQYLKKAGEIVSQCDRCGACLPVCPLFGAKDIEFSSARGKNNVARGILQGVIRPTAEALDVLNFCLLCRTCVDNCPSKVQTDEAMIAVRQYFAEKNGTPGAKYKALGNLMKSRTLVKFSAGALKVLRKTGLNNLAPGGMVPGEFTRREYLASFAGPAILSGSVPSAPAPLSKKDKVAYFRGCGMHMMFPNAEKESIAILRSVTNLQLVDNLCCGLPHLAHGLRDDFLSMAKKNIVLFENAAVIVSDCASCSGTLKHIGAYFADDPEWKDRASAFSQKVMDFSEYLTNIGYTPRHRLDAKLTFHEPCHLGRGQGIKNQPRDLLRVAGDYIEMKGANVCCGGAGSFHMDYPEVATSILDKKRINIENSGAQIVVTECPTCLVQLSKAAANSGGKFKVMHISQVI